MQCIDVKVTSLFQNVMILQRELRLCNVHIIYWLLYDPGGGAFARAQCPHPGEFANFIKKNANAWDLVRMGGGGDGHRWN